MGLYLLSPHPKSNTKLGSKEFWEISKGMNSDDEDEAYDPGAVRKKGAGPKISVRKSRW